MSLILHLYAYISTKTSQYIDLYSLIILNNVIYSLVDQYNCIVGGMQGLVMSPGTGYPSGSGSGSGGPPSLPPSLPPAQMFNPYAGYQIIGNYIGALIYQNITFSNLAEFIQIKLLFGTSNIINHY